jgi:HK97 family phage prohead protease
MEKRYVTREMPTLDARAMFVPKSMNDEERTVDVIVATNKPVRMWSFDKGSHLEELDMSGANLERMDRAPVFDNHVNSGASGQLGAVVPGSARAENGNLLATLRFSKNDNVTPIWNNVRDGILSNISVGYMVEQAEQVRKNEDGTKVFRATRWTPYEVSLAPVPADHTATVRGGEQKYNAEIEEEQIEDDTAQRDHDFIYSLRARHKNYK